MFDSLGQFGVFFLIRLADVVVIYGHELFCDREKRIKGKEGEGEIGEKEEQTQPKVSGQNVEQKLSCLVGPVSWSEWRLEWMCHVWVISLELGL